jgi:predicted transcriptional regulator
MVLETTCKLLFELSSNERMNVLLGLQKQRMKLSHISKKLDMTVTEASRHLQRLSEAKLIQKDVDGSYGLSPFGTLTLSLLLGLNFVSENRQYFLEHDVSYLPSEFISRIGELSASSLGTRDIMTGFRLAEIMLQEASEYIWILSDQVLTSGVPIIGEKVKSGVEFRFIFPENLVPPPGVKPVPGTQRRNLSRVEEIILMTDKEAWFGFPDLNGKIDYALFIGKDPRFHKWCRDLFQYRWEQAKPALSPVK